MIIGEHVYKKAMNTQKLLKLHEAAGAILLDVLEIMRTKRKLFDELTSDKISEPRRGILQHRIKLLNLKQTDFENQYFDISIKIMEVQNGN